jgi:hypothetical protein
MNRPFITRPEDQCEHCRAGKRPCLRQSWSAHIGPCDELLAHFREGAAQTSRAWLDASLSALRQLCDDINAERVNVTIRVDGRVRLSFEDGNGYLMRGVDADLHPDSALSAPNAALHAVFSQWSGT